MNEIKIEKNVPMMEGRPNAFISSLKTMEIGDSFLYPEQKRSNLSHYSKRAGIKVASRKVSQTEVRIWRIA